MDRGPLEQQPLLNPQLACDPSYGIIVRIGESLRPGAGAINADSSDESDLFLSVSDSEMPPFMTQRELPDGQHQQDSAFPGGDPAPEPPLNRPLVPAGEEEEDEEEEDEETVCKCCTSWYDWCLFLSCKLTVVVSPLRMPLRERKCLRRARTEGWRLLWSLILPLAVGSVPLQLVWVIAQLVTSLALFGLSVADLALACVNNSSGCNGWNVACVSVSGVWMLLTVVDTIVCFVAMWFWGNNFVWKISCYVTILRVLYTVVCLYIVVTGLVYLSYLSESISQLSKARAGFSVASLCVFFDLAMLIVFVLFMYKTLKIRNTYFHAHGQPSYKGELLCTFHVAFEFVIHLLFLSSLVFYIFVLDMYFSPTVWLGVFSGLSISVPFFGLLSIYFIDYFWLQEYLASVCLSVQSILQDRDTAARLRIPVNICERLQERTQEIDLEQLKNSVVNFKGEVTLIRKLVHACQNPFSVIYSLFLVSLLSLTIFVMFCFTPFSLFSLIASIIAVSVFSLVHFRVIIFALVFLSIAPFAFIVIVTSLVCLCLVCTCFLPLLWPHCTSQNCRRCTNYSQVDVDLIP